LNIEKEISSTEKLLDSIRGKAGSSSNAEDLSTPLPLHKETQKPRIGKVIPFLRPVAIGVDIDAKELRLVKIFHSHSRWQLLGYKSVRRNPNMSIKSPLFKDFLRSELAAFCSNVKNFDIWCSLSSDRASLWQIKIPKVPKSQIANAVYWTTKKDSKFDNKETILDFKAQGQISEKGVQKISIMVYTAPKQEVEDLKVLFSESGFSLTGISTPSFAIQNLLKTKWVSPFDETIANLYIGSDLSRIDIFFKGYLILSRGIRTGTDSMIDSLTEVEESLMMDIGEPEEFAKMDRTQATQALQSLQNDSLAPLNMTKEEIFSKIQPALERLVRQTERTFEYYTLTLGEKKVDSMYVHGSIACHEPLIDYLNNQLGIPAHKMDPLKSKSIYSGGVHPPSSMPDRMGFIQAAGLALSDNSYTPNMLFTQDDKEKVEKKAKINRNFFLVFLLMVGIGAGISLWKKHLINGKNAEVKKLQQQLKQYQPLLNRNSVFKLAVQAKQQRRINKNLSKKYLTMGVINEVTNLTVGNIRLLSVNIDVGGIDKTVVKKGALKDGAKVSKQILTLDGLIIGDPDLFESTLAGYLMKLDRSPLFKEPEAPKTSIDFSHKYKKVMHFNLKLQIEGGKV